VTRIVRPRVGSVALPALLGVIPGPPVPIGKEPS
jgi:hypothetical protein